MLIIYLLNLFFLSAKHFLVTLIKAERFEGSGTHRLRFWRIAMMSSSSSGWNATGFWLTGNMSSRRLLHKHISINHKVQLTVVFSQVAIKRISWFLSLAKGELFITVADWALLTFRSRILSSEAKCGATGRVTFTGGRSWIPTGPCTFGMGRALNLKSATFCCLESCNIRNKWANFNSYITTFPSRYCIKFVFTTPRTIEWSK